MWHEARRREKATQKLLIDHRKRAEKRREEDRIDPNSLLQVHGFKSRLYPDLNAHKQIARSLVSWQGDNNVTIDRFDVRATLSTLPVDDVGEKKKFKPRGTNESKAKVESVVDIEETESMKKLLTFERYRLLMQNDLNRVPEENRLKLVAKSECFTDARLRKLQRNKFGTSGETNKPSKSASLMGGKNAQNNPVNQQPIRQRPGVSIGFDYGQTSQKNHNPADDARSEEIQSTRNVIDLDDFEEIDLDDISASSKHGSKRTNEVTSKYGLTFKEFDLFQSQEERNLMQSDLLKELKRLKDKNMIQSSKNGTNLPPEVYGPALPPEMLSKFSQASPSSSDSSSQQSPPVGQRSPSGAEIPMRNAEEKSDVEGDRFPAYQNTPKQTTDTKTESSIDVKPIHFKYIGSSRAGDVESNGSRLAKQINTSPKPSSSREGDQSSCLVDEVDDSVDDPKNLQTETRRSRRAVTPLAYKRHRRSSRSLSRDRRTTYHLSSKHRDDRKQDRTYSSSSMSTSSSSNTSDSSYSGSSASDVSEDSCSSISSTSSQDYRERKQSEPGSTSHGKSSKITTGREISHHSHQRRSRRVRR